jgi:Trk K+ transport system NAD-binding subunit
MGTRVLDYLLAAEMTVVVIDTVCKPDDPRLRGVKLISGDCRRREVLEAAGVAGARGVLIVTADDLLNVSTALMVRSLNREVPIVLRMFNQNLLGRLGKAVHNVYALSTSLLTAPIVAMTALTGQGLGTFRLDDTGQGVRQVVEVTVGANSPLRDQRLDAVARPRDLAVLAHLPASGDDRYLLEVDLEARLAAGDRVVVCGEPRVVAPLLSAGKEDAEQLRWANVLLRWGRIARRTLAEVELMVLLCTIVLFTVVIISTLVLHLGVTRFSIVDALFRTVSIMATSADMRDSAYEGMPRMRVFVSILRIVGAVLLAAFTAIVTNYLVRARLGGVLEVRRIPESGHFIVCGLSSVGFRVVEELIRQGERVVAIEADTTNRFVTTARRLGAAVMVGDAGVIEVLRQAHAGSARAVIPTTNNDMTNLEVALLVRELKADLRVVVLLNEPHFANMLREAASIHLAVSVPGLAAPAFVAGLFGDRVPTVFLLRDRLFAVIDLLINEQDPFVGHAVRAVAIDYQVLPVVLLRGSERVRPLWASRLQAGDRLIGIMDLTALDRLFRRQPCSAAFAVDVMSCPIPTRSWLAGLLRTTMGVGAEDAERCLDQMPLRLATSLTRGQAEDLLVQLSRERVAARVCPADEGLPAKR